MVTDVQFDELGRSTFGCNYEGQREWACEWTSARGRITSGGSVKNTRVKIGKHLSRVHNRKDAGNGKTVKGGDKGGGNKKVVCGQAHWRCSSSGRNGLAYRTDQIVDVDIELLSCTARWGCPETKARRLRRRKASIKDVVNREPAKMIKIKGKNTLVRTNHWMT